MRVMSFASGVALLVVTACGPALARVSGTDPRDSSATSGFVPPTDVQCQPASLEQLRDMGCRIEQAGCTGLREYQRETLDAMERRRIEGRASEIDNEVNPRIKAFLEQLLHDKSC